jgi:oligopeptide transport system substrate-binding protein
MPGHCAGIALSYNPARARQLLSEAGYPDGRGFPAVEALTWPGHPIVEVIDYLQAQWWENLGVEISWKQLEWRNIFDRMDGKVPSIWILGLEADYPDPDSFLRAGGWRARTGWSSAVYDELVENARRVMDQDERMRMYRQAETILADEVPVLPLGYRRNHLLVKPWVRQLHFSPMGAVNREDVIIEPH